MADDHLRNLVVRRLFELGGTLRDASRRAAWAVAPETLERLASGRHSGLVSERLAHALSQALQVPENRVRRAAGLPEVPEVGVDQPTGPWLRLVWSDGRPARGGR